MSKTSPSSQRGTIGILAVIIGVGLLAALAFSLNALFTFHTKQSLQVAIQPKGEQQTNRRIAEQASPNSTVIASQTDPTAGWLTATEKESATNVEWEYSVKYPADFFYRPGPSALITSYDPSITPDSLQESAQGEIVQIQIVWSGRIKGNETLLGYIKRLNPEEDPFNDPGTLAKYDVVKESKGYISESTGRIWIENQGLVFRISTFNSPRQVVDSILSTLTFSLR